MGWEGGVPLLLCSGTLKRRGGLRVIIYPYSSVCTTFIFVLIEDMVSNLGWNVFPTEKLPRAPLNNVSLVPQVLKRS